MADLQSVKDDIAFMRALATEGRSAPLLGGAIMIAAGLIFAAASLTHYAVAVTGAHVTLWIYPIIWFAAGRSSPWRLRSSRRAITAVPAVCRQEIARCGASGRA